MESAHPPSLPPEPELASATQPPAADDPEPTPPRGHGGARENSGRRKMAKRRKLSESAFVSLSTAEHAALKRAARDADLSVSFYLRKKLKLPIG